MLCKCGKGTCTFGGRFFISILEAFLIKQLLNSRLLDMT